MDNYSFLDNNGSFELKNAQEDLGLYFPIASEKGLKSAISSNLAGDSKLDQNHFLFEPVSIENLHNNKSTRNFWIKTSCPDNEKRDGIFSVTGASATAEAKRYTGCEDTYDVQAGFMWMKLLNSDCVNEISSEITSFMPVNENVEVMIVKLTNMGKEPITITPTAAIPIYGRSADNIRDHRHVTSLLHRGILKEHGIEVVPTLSFDERGHGVNDTKYYVKGYEQDGSNPVGFFPEVAEFIGKKGSFYLPKAIYTDDVEMITYNKDHENDSIPAGQELVGAIRFKDKTLKPGESFEYYIFMGICAHNENPEDILLNISKSENLWNEFKNTKKYWTDNCNVSYKTGNNDFDQYMKWISFQPELRRLFGCSFLPHHDYGKGGRGWRDLWQDCLALLIMNPVNVRKMLVANYGGVRIDGSNATIIGDKLGEFKADRNSITRVWMDHGVWPMFTTKFYIDQTGDFGILYEKVPYFKDRQVKRGTFVDDKWNGEKWQHDINGNEIRGTILEHLLLQNLTAFYEVGDHNNIRLRDADWNDAIDMASHKGESVAFTNAYALNLKTLADILSEELSNGVASIDVLKEIIPLINDLDSDYDDINCKTAILDNYMNSCTHDVSGEYVSIATETVIASLNRKSEWIKNHIQEKEWVKDDNGLGWFNGYYDDNGRKVEGIIDGSVRMMLTGQVFSIMAGTANDEQIKAITKAADKYLYDEACGGYRLNTDFNEVKMDMGRMFGFAFGEKENGAVFSHMAVMYANALYQRGYAKEGFKSLNALFKQSMNYEKSRIYPGIPEYFGKDGRGLYHYLTGAASWYMMTVITQMYGVRGDKGDLRIQPNLLKEQFDNNNEASIKLQFADINWNIVIKNPKKLEVGEYKVEEATLNDEKSAVMAAGYVIEKELFKSLDKNKVQTVIVTLG